MKCDRLINRNLYNAFKIYSCNNCNIDYIYEYIYIGNNTINIYKENNECINNYKKQKTLNLFLKECSLNNDDLFLILDIKELYKVYDYLPLLLDNNDLYILIL